MHTHQLTDRLSVAAQISADDLVDIAAAGFRSVINNRPDGEAEGQPSNAALAVVAAQHGLAWRYLPVRSGQVSDQDADDFAGALRDLPPPVLAFCRSGTRSTSLWALQAAGGADAILDVAGQAGYDLTALRPRLLQRGSR